MSTETARRRVRAEIARLARAGLDNDGFRLAAADVLRQAVGFDRWCWTLLDPAAGLPTATCLTIRSSAGRSAGSTRCTGTGSPRLDGGYVVTLEPARAGDLAAALAGQAAVPDYQ